MDASGEEADYERVRAQVARAVSRLCPSWLSADRDDIIQLAVLRVRAASASREGSGAHSASYMWKAAFSTVIDEIRRRSRRPETPRDSVDGDELRDFSPTPEDQAAARELGRAIRGCLADLVSPRRMAVVLHLQGHRVPEIAARLRWATKKADNLVYRGLTDLRRCLTSKGFGRDEDR